MVDKTNIKNENINKFFHSKNQLWSKYRNNLQCLINIKQSIDKNKQAQNTKLDG